MNKMHTKLSKNNGLLEERAANDRSDMEIFDFTLKTRGRSMKNNTGRRTMSPMSYF